MRREGEKLVGEREGGASHAPPRREKRAMSGAWCATRPRAGRPVTHLARHAHAAVAHLVEQPTDEAAREAVRVVHIRIPAVDRPVDDDALVDFLRLEEHLSAEPGPRVSGRALVEQAAAAAIVRARPRDDGRLGQLKA